MATMSLPTRRPGYGALWFGFLGAPIAWSVQEVAGYALMAHVCFPIDQPVAHPSFGGAWLTTLIFTIVLLVISLASLAVAGRNWRETRDDTQPDGGRWHVHADSAKAFRYLSFSGILFGAIFSAIIVFNGIGLLSVTVCGGPQ